MTSNGFRAVCGVLGAAVLAALGLWSPPAACAAWPSDVPSIAVPAVRIEGHDVASLASRAASTAYPGWVGVDHVVIASGELAARTDVAIASSLCWAYDAPLLLSSRTSLPAETHDALAAIASVNPSVTVHVVGSSTSVPAEALAQIRSIVGTGAVEQPWPGASKYSLATGVARRVRLVAAEKGSTLPTIALVANGADASRMWDAAAAASVSRATGAPVLLTGSDFVPLSTAAFLAEPGAPRAVVIGGTGSVSSAVHTALGAVGRWGGATRFGTAATVARRTTAAGWYTTSTFGLAATPIDALVAAEVVGRHGGVVLLTGHDRIDRASWGVLAPAGASLTRGYLLGSARSISSAQLAEVRGAPAKPWLSEEAPGTYVAKRFRISGFVGGNTTHLDIWVHGAKVRSIAVKPWTAFNFTSVDMPAERATVSAVSSNPDTPTAVTSRRVVRLKYPSATCIVIDKSDFRLYWVKDNRLVHAYPIATGRESMETPAPATWKILAKYHTDPGSVYGPRKMRLFRHRGSGYVFTRYGIHGTNQPWVIGTKASHGCIRMYNHDVLELFPQVPLGTMVYTRP